MADSYEVKIPQFDSVTLTPNPVSAGASVVLAVFVSEITVSVEAELRYSGEFFSGEV